MTLVGLARAGVRRIHHELTQWYYLLAHRWFQVLFAVAYLTAIGSIGHFLWRSGTYPTTWDFLLLVVVLTGDLGYCRSCQSMGTYCWSQAQRC